MSLSGPATYGWEWLAELLEAAGYEVHLAHPLATKAIAAARVKMDTVDARILGHLLRAERPTPPRASHVTCWAAAPPLGTRAPARLGQAPGARLDRPPRDWPPLRRMRVLTQIRGVGRYTALLVIAEVGDVSRFPSAHKLRAGAGCPKQPERTRPEGTAVKFYELRDNLAGWINGVLPPTPHQRQGQGGQIPEAPDRAHDKARPFMADI